MLVWTAMELAGCLQGWPAGLNQWWETRKRKRKMMALACAMVQCFDESVGPYLDLVDGCDSFEDGFEKVLDYFGLDHQWEYDIYNQVWAAWVVFQKNKEQLFNASCQNSYVIYRIKPY